MARSSFSTRTRTRSPRLTCRTTTTSASLGNEVERNVALADVELARVEWETAFGLVPDGALAYLKPGDDYALGGLQVHVNWVLTHYRRVLDGIVAGGFKQLGPQDSAGEGDAAGQKAKEGLADGERAKALSDMGKLHAAVTAAVGRA